MVSLTMHKRVRDPNINNTITYIGNPTIIHQVLVDKYFIAYFHGSSSCYS